MSILEVLAVIAIVIYVIARQLVGEKLRGKRLILLPLVLVLVGAGDLTSHGRHPQPADVAMIVVECLVAAGLGVAQGAGMRLEERDGALWGQMPRRSLWLWVALVASRAVLALVASGLGAHVAASTAPVIMTLGINRLSQAAVVAFRAWSAGIPFAPEEDGSTFTAGAFARRPVADVAPRDRAAAAERRSATERGAATGHRREDATGWQAAVSMIAGQLSARRRAAPQPAPGRRLGGGRSRVRAQHGRAGRRRR